MTFAADVPATFRGIGYTKDRDGFPLEAFEIPVERPGEDQILVHVAFSSLNPLEYKLAELNFFGRKPPVVLGFDVAGIIVATGSAVEGFAVGDEVFGFADSDGDGGWAEGGKGGYALTRDYLTVKKPAGISLKDAATLPVCFTAAWLGLKENLQKGDTIYIPGGGGGVGHLAVQMAARALGAGLVISSAGSAASIAVAKASGADRVFNYRTDDIAAEIANLTGGRGVDVVFDPTYSEAGFVSTARLVREGGRWVVLGVGPGKTTRRETTASEVDPILASKGARHVNANMLAYYTKPSTLDAAAKTFLRSAMDNCAAWAAKGIVLPHVGTTIPSTASAINAGLAEMKAGKGPVGKVSVIVDRTFVPLE